MTNILVVEGDTITSTLVALAMRSKGWVVDVTDDGPTAVALVRTGGYRLVILDLEHPRRAGPGILQDVLDAKPDQKVIVLCGAGSADSGIQALAHGASDYLARPFSVDELLARVSTRQQESPAGDSGWYLHGSGLTLDLARRTANSGHGEVRLTQREFVLLVHLVSDRGRVFRRQELLTEVWRDTVDSSSNVVDVCVRRLRAKLGENVIVTVRNVGYTVRSP